MLAFFIMRGDIGVTMYSAVHFHDQSMLRTIKIQNECLQSVLATKSSAVKLSQTQAFP
jgi:hypothetical protein